jgi:hypothetical protein
MLWMKYLNCQCSQCLNQGGWNKGDHYLHNDRDHCWETFRQQKTPTCKLSQGKTSPMPCSISLNIRFNHSHQCLALQQNLHFLNCLNTLTEVMAFLLLVRQKKVEFRFSREKQRERKHQRHYSKPALKGEICTHKTVLWVARGKRPCTQFFGQLKRNLRKSNGALTR